MKRISFLSITVLILLNACKKSETFVTDTIADYAPYEVGKYITYKLDSLKFLNFGTTPTVISYQVKYQVDAAITDNLGRPAFRVLRFIRKTANDVWMADNTFMAVPEDKTLEFIEDNFRYIKLKTPIYIGYSWKGNTHIDAESQNSDVQYLSGWDYTYDSVTAPIVLGNINIENSLKVAQIDETINDPGNPNVYSQRNIGIEKYAKGIGMVYRKFLHTEYQPATNNSPAAYSDESYGITLTMIDHN